LGGGGSNALLTPQAQRKWRLGEGATRESPAAPQKNNTKYLTKNKKVFANPTNESR